MHLEEELLKSIERQFMTHSHANLFYTHHETGQQFLPESKEIIEGQKQTLLEINNKSGGDEWIDMMTRYALKTFCNTNQFLDLREKNLSALREVYTELWREIIAEIQKNEIDFDLLQHNHVQRLKTWVVQTNNFASVINSNDSPEVIQVVCAEYSATLQLQLLHINIESLNRPILDIGCGENAYLVCYLRNAGFDTFGMDRMINVNSASHFINEDWMDYTFKPESWGTIIANNSFALHFIHQNERTDGDFISYAKKYMEILHSLQIGGTFFYAPSLPFIEGYLPEAAFEVRQFRINEHYSASHIMRK